MLMRLACVESNLDNSFDPQSTTFPLGLVIGFDSSGAGVGANANSSNVASGGAGDQEVNIPPADISLAQAEPIGDDTIRVIWEAVGEDDMSGAAPRYEIRYDVAPITDDDECRSASESVDPGVTEDAGTMLNFEIDGLSTQTDYYFCVHAFDTKNARNTWTLGNVSARIDPLPADITVAQADPIDDDTIRVHWNAVGEDHMTGAALRYEIRYAPAPITDNASCHAAPHAVDPGVSASAGSPLDFDIDGLATHTDYYFCVYAFDAGDTRNAWTLGNITARINPLPADVSVASASGIAIDTVRLQWNAVGEDGNTGAATRYEIGYSTAPIGNNAACDAATRLAPGVPALTAGSALSYNVTGLLNNTKYWFCIRAHDAADQGNRWTVVSLSATTPEGTAGWGPWGGFGPCSANCAGGTMTQTRACVNPAGGCAGPGSNTEDCNRHVCPMWSGSTTFPWSSGSLSCPAGYRVTGVGCTAGRIAFEAYDHFCDPPCACGGLSRGGFFHNATFAGSSGIGSSTGTCNFNFTIGNNPPMRYCQVFIGTDGRRLSPWPHLGPTSFFNSRWHRINISCQQNP